MLEMNVFHGWAGVEGGSGDDDHSTGTTTTTTTTTTATHLRTHDEIENEEKVKKKFRWKMEEEEEVADQIGDFQRCIRRIKRKSRFVLNGLQMIVYVSKDSFIFRI